MLTHLLTCQTPEGKQDILVSLLRSCNVHYLYSCWCCWHHPIQIFFLVQYFVLFSKYLQSDDIPIFFLHDWEGRVYRLTCDSSVTCESVCYWTLCKLCLNFANCNPIPYHTLITTVYLWPKFFSVSINDMSKTCVSWQSALYHCQLKLTHQNVYLKIKCVTFGGISWQNMIKNGI